MKTITFEVKGMHCTSCEMLVVDSLEDLEGVERATASHSAEQVTITYDEGKTGPAAFKKMIKAEGYSVRG